MIKCSEYKHLYPRYRLLVRHEDEVYRLVHALQEDGVHQFPKVEPQLVAVAVGRRQIGQLDTQMDVIGIIRVTKNKKID